MKVNNIMLCNAIPTAKGTPEINPEINNDKKTAYLTSALFMQI